MRCQTGNLLAERGFTDIEKILNGAFTRDGGPLQTLSSRLVFWNTEEESCMRAGMIPPAGQRSPVYGSSSVLWPLFMSLCISHFAETISCALEGRQPMAETGMTIFEHSLAYAEAESVVRSSVGLGLFGLPSISTTPSSTSSGAAAPSPSSAERTKQLLTRGMIMQRLNVPPEVLLIALISSLSHLSSHVLGVLGLQSRFRLVNTGVWGIAFMCAFGWSFVKFSQASDQTDLGVLRYPTVCIIGFIPHLMIIAGSFICMGIYGLAVLLTVLSPPPEMRSHTLRERLAEAHSNLQANAFLSHIHITWQDEFYTTLLKVGFQVLTAATEAVYFNEGAVVTLNQRTWLEEKRMDELAQTRKVLTKVRENIPQEIRGGIIADGLGLIDSDSFPENINVPIASGYARERKTTKPTAMAGAAAMKEEGTGGSQRSGRLVLSWMLFKQISQLVVCCLAKGAASLLTRSHLIQPPRWLKEMATLPAVKEVRTSNKKSSEEQKTLEFWMLSEDGSLHLPSGVDVDVEYETRKRLLHSDEPQDGSERAIDKQLYSWWKNGGWWGEIDSSGNYQPSAADEDDVSVASTVDEDGTAWESESEDGRRTPTQARYSQSRGSTQAPDTSLEHLARLLDPKSLEDKQEARLLAQRLQNDGPMTRAQYRKALERERLRLIAPSNKFSNGAMDADLSRQEEEDLLEQIIVSRRSATSPSSGTRSWNEGAEGMGESGPQCVVCHSTARTIIVWPCRCLSLCEDCRVSLAMNNFGSCVCCRRDVVAFSRLYVP